MSVFDRLAGQEDVVTQLRAAARAARAMIVAADGTSTTGGTVAPAQQSESTSVGAPTSTLTSAGKTGKASAEMTHAWLFTCLLYTSPSPRD